MYRLSNEHQFAAINKKRMQDSEPMSKGMSGDVQTWTNRAITEHYVSRINLMCCSQRREIRDHQGKQEIFRNNNPSKSGYRHPQRSIEKHRILQTFSRDFWALVRAVASPSARAPCVSSKFSWLGCSKFMFDNGNNTTLMHGCVLCDP